MRVMTRRFLSSILVLSMFIITIAWVPMVPNATLADSSFELQDDTSPIDMDKQGLDSIEDVVPEDRDPYQLADAAPADGILNPVQVEQSGYAASDNISARTDSFQNLRYDLPLDVAHNWAADLAEVSVWNLEKLYVVNGTYSQGYPGVNVNPNGTIDYYPLGWSANSTDTATYDDDVQLAAYDDSGRQYVMVESQGGKVGQNAFGHEAGTRVVWTQSVQNTPYTEEFLLNFDYFYLRGPLDKNPGVPVAITGNCSITVSIDGTTIWNMSLLTLSQRGIWTDSGVIPISIPSAPASFNFEIGLVIDGLMELDKRYDYDNNGIADGIGNAAYITVYLDDVSFIKAAPPTAEQVQLEFNTGGTSSALTGSLGTYNASITNSSYWTTTPVPVSLTTNTSVSFDYKTRLLSHRFTNSNWRTDISSFGVAYMVDHGVSSDLTFYTYVGYLGDYEDPKMMVVFPDDWENLTISDPFLTDLTSSCTIGESYLTVPTSIIDRLGWWEVKLQSPNYAKSIKSQIQDVGWTDATIFKIENTTRAEITIGTDTETLGSLTDVNVTWFKPSDAIWATELRSGGVLGQIYSSAQVFNSGSSPAGEWWVEVYWSNGTEVAYDMARFEVHHTANLVAEPAEISTDTGLTIKGIVRYTDGDTSDYILDASATLEANWSGSTIPMVAIPAQNWWEANFDTSITGAGDFVIVVYASRPYYDDISCQIVVHSTRVTRLSSPDAPWTAAKWGDIVSLTFNYEAYDYGGDTWGPIINETDISVSANWTAGYWSVTEDITPGIYVMDLDTSVEDVGTLLLNVTFSKPNHQSKIILITLIISPTSSSLSIIEGISARVDLDEPYPLILMFLDYESTPISGANVVVDSMDPSIGLERTAVTEIGGEPGNYSVTLTPHNAGVFTIRFVASKQNSENATAVFVLVVNDVATEVDIPGTGSVEIGLTDVYNTTFRFQMLNGTGIGNAQINITYTGGAADALSWDLADSGLGDYSVEFSSTSSGTYLITIAAFKQYYQSASDAFFLVIREISTNFTCLNGTADLVSFGKDYNLLVSYTNGTGHGLAGANVTIESVTSDSTIEWGTTQPGVPGIYSILLTPQAADTFTILIQAKLDNHQTQFALFTLTATSIATTLSILNASTSISLDQNFTVTLRFQDEDLIGLENAIIIIQNPPTGVAFSQVANLTEGFYQLTITPFEAGTFDIVFSASKDGYQTDFASFTLTATIVQSDLVLASGLSFDSITYKQQYDIVILYTRIDTGQNITGASIEIQTSTSGLQWDYSEGINGGYLITLDPQKAGNWTLYISASLDNHELSSTQFRLEVKPISININFVTELSAMENRPFDILIKLTDDRTNDTIDDALVWYRFSVSKAGLFREMNSTGVAGEYFATVSVPLFANAIYRLEINVEKENYVLDEIVDVPFVITSNFIERNSMIITASSGVSASLVIFFVALRIISTRRKKQIECDIKNKRRFEDADNIIGVIVMHKKSGIPIFSRIVKGGFDEGIVAAFISAVTHFREEFDMMAEDTMTVIPISDIIRAVQTRNLICAFVTLRSASMEHNRKMESFGMQVSTYLDDFYTESTPSGVLDSRIVEILDYVFEETMDGHLIKFYKAKEEDRQFPRRYRLLQQLLEDLETRHCSRPIHLAQGVATFGVSEAHGCTLVLEAIEKDLIEQCEDHESTVEELDFVDFFKKPKNNEE
jgi:hypothetical protein